MQNKKKLHFVKNIEDTKHEKANCTTFEYEVISDSNIIGNLEYGPYSFSMWEFSDKKEGEERKLCLSITSKRFDSENLNIDDAKRKGFYHGGGIAEEIISLASLIFRRRLKLGPVTRIDNRPSLYLRENDFLDKQLITGDSNLGSLFDWLKFVEGLNAKYDLSFILAVRLYHKSLLLIDEEPDLAYLNLISAIEVLCQDTDIGEVTLYDVDKRLASLVYALEDNVKNEIERSILKREKFIKRRFVKFILDYIEDSFWSEVERPALGKINPSDLQEYLERIYDQRSRTLHSGEPFPPFIFRAPMHGAEIEFAFSLIIGEKKWEQKDYIPYPHFFERLVNHVIKNFLKRNQD